MINEGTPSNPTAGQGLEFDISVHLMFIMIIQLTNYVVYLVYFSQKLLLWFFHRFCYTKVAFVIPTPKIHMQRQLYHSLEYFLNFSTLLDITTQVHHQTEILQKCGQLKPKTSICLWKKCRPKFYPSCTSLRHCVGFHYNNNYLSLWLSCSAHATQRWLEVLD